MGAPSTPDTKALMRPPVASQISSPVWKWTRKLARFSNWSAKMALLVSAAFRRAMFTKCSVKENSIKGMNKLANRQAGRHTT
eukprot:scaffold50267_cov51-Prasinocladus_malaysianus.AAC.1